MTRTSGFTIVELLIVVAIIGILVAIGALAVRPALAQGQMNEAIATIETEIENARRLAKRQDTVVPFQLNQAGGQWRVVVAGDPVALPATVAIPSGTVDIDLNPPFGTYGGAQFDIDVVVGGLTRTVTVTGVLARTVVQ